MAAQVLEGTWEEISEHSKRLLGKRLRVTILDEEPTQKPVPNQRAFAAIKKVRERQKGYARDSRRKRPRNNPPWTCGRNVWLGE